MDVKEKAFVFVVFQIKPEILKALKDCIHVDIAEYLPYVTGDIVAVLDKK